MRAFNFFPPRDPNRILTLKISPWKRRLKMQQTPLAVPFLVPTRAHSELFVALMGLRPPFPCSLSLERLHDDGFSSKNGTPFAFLSVVQRPPCASISIHRSRDQHFAWISVKRWDPHKRPNKPFAESFIHIISLFIRGKIYLDPTRIVSHALEKKEVWSKRISLNPLDRGIAFNDRIRKYALLRLTQFPPSRSFQFSQSFVAIVCRVAARFNGRCAVAFLALKFVICMHLLEALYTRVKIAWDKVRLPFFFLTPERRIVEANVYRERNLKEISKKRLYIIYFIKRLFKISSGFLATRNGRMMGRAAKLIYNPFTNEKTEIPNYIIR